MGARVVVAIVLIALATLAWRAFLDADNLVALEDRRDDYEQIVALAAASCHDHGACMFGWRSRDPFPASMRRLMPRVRARQVSHDSVVNQTMLRGGYGAEYDLVYSHPETPKYLRARAFYEAQRASDEAKGWRFAPAPEVVDGRWAMVRRR